MSAFETISRDHWEDNWSHALPSGDVSRLNVFNRDLDFLLDREIARPNPEVVEIGFAPGKMLRHIEKRFSARCTGYDYSEVGCAVARCYLEREGSVARVVLADVEREPPPTGSADVCYSIGVVEHFANPDAIVRAHVDCLKPGGKAIIIMPAYRGLAAALQRRLDPDNLAIHNLELLEPRYWLNRAAPRQGLTVRAFTFGRVNPWMFSWSRFGRAGRLAQYAINFMAMAVPRKLTPLPSMIVVIYERDATV
jgi:SAM-dependent methyltransferase